MLKIVALVSEKIIQKLFTKKPAESYRPAAFHKTKKNINSAQKEDK